MKEYRIISVSPYRAVINVRDGESIWTGYTLARIAARDMERLKAKHPEMQFEVVRYVALEV